MIIPVRCFTCGRVIGQDYESWRDRVAEGQDPKKVLDDLDVQRYCCRRMILSHVDLLKQSGLYE